MSSSKKAPKKRPEECVRTCPGNQEAKRASSTTIRNNPKELTFNSSVLPIIPSKPEKYTPILYTFRIPLASLYAPIKNGLVKCPPFYLLLDHTLAVIWTLFTKCAVPKELGIVQLQWALGFLRTIHNTRGEYTKDVQLCIIAIEDQLIELYADMVDEVKKIPKKKKSCSSCCKKSSTTVESVEDIDITLKQNYVKKCIPFSINYNELLKRNANLKPNITKVNLTTSATCGSASSQKVSPNAQETTQMIEFLNTWRSEQIRKIEAELKRLHSIENFIANTNKNNYPSNVDNSSTNGKTYKSPPEKGCPSKTCNKNLN